MTLIIPIRGITRQIFIRPKPINAVQPVAHLISAGKPYIEIINASAAKTAASKSDKRKITPIGNLI
jgi:hypothetical protein